MWQLKQPVVTVNTLWNLPLAQVVMLPLWQASQLAADDTGTVWYGTWFVGLPSAGGKAPLWQLAHCAVTVTCVWLKLEGFHVVVVWQAMQFVAATGTWVADLPVALLLLWQLAQLVAAVYVLWSTLAPSQVVVDLWQLSQLPVTVACVGFEGLTPRVAIRADARFKPGRDQQQRKQ